jgi:hypothetical protein
LTTPPAFITILKAALKTERGEDAPVNPRIRFNDLSTADLFIQVMPDGPLLSLHKTIIQTNLFFASFDLAVIDRIFNIDAPDPETCSFVIECIYHFSSIERVVKLDDVLFQGFVDEYIKRKFVGVLRNASFFRWTIYSLAATFCLHLHFNFANRFPEIWNTVVSQDHFNHKSY